MDKIYKVLVDILDLEVGFTLSIFSYEATFSFENNKKQDLILLSLLRKKSQTNENSAKSRFVRKKFASEKPALIAQANGSKVVYLSADPNVGSFKGRFLLVR